VIRFKIALIVYKITISNTPYCLQNHNLKHTLRLSQKPINSLGDLVPFSNKVCSGDLEKRLGITAGMSILIQRILEKNEDRYEAVYSLYLKWRQVQAVLHVLLEGYS
jgi:hypothetical protein